MVPPQSLSSKSSMTRHCHIRAQRGRGMLLFWDCQAAIPIKKKCSGDVILTAVLFSIIKKIRSSGARMTYCGDSEFTEPWGEKRNRERMVRRSDFVSRVNTQSLPSFSTHRFLLLLSCQPALSLQDFLRVMTLIRRLKKTKKNSTCWGFWSDSAPSKRL